MRVYLAAVLLLFPAFLFAWEIQPLDSPAGPGSGQPELAELSHSVLMSWLQAVPEGGHALHWSRWNGDRWTAPGTIAAGIPFFVNWADFPSVLPISDTTMAAHWLEKHKGGDAHSYDVKITTSVDGGRTWNSAQMPHRDGKAAEHGFVSMFRLGTKELGTVWLDGRNKETSLMFTTLSNSQFTSEQVLDPRVCDCCQTAVASTPDGVVVFYRDRSNEELRDISYVRYVNGKWSEPQLLYEDGWKINACPVNGPAAAAEGKKVAVAWFTAVEGQPRVFVAFSVDGGSTFGKPVRVDGGNPLGRVDVVTPADGSALVSWMENSDSGAEIRVRPIRPDGTAEAAFSVASTGGARAAGFPRMVRSGDGALIAWTDSGDPPRVRAARIVP